MANGLINLQTDLKSLKYSSIPLGSQSPYVTKDIGQAPGNQIGREIQSRIDDTSRIAQMLVDKPGLKYLANEALLQQTNIQDKLQKARDKGKTLGGAILQQLGSTAVNTVKIAASTLAQVPVNGTGTHFLKGFRTDTYLQPTNGNQVSGFAQFFGAGGVEGAPLALQGNPIEGKAQSNFGQEVSPTEFKVTAQSALDYDDYLNKPIPEGSEVNRSLAESGKPITLPGPQYETTAQPYQLGRSNTLSEADQQELLPDNGNDGSQKYTPGNTYTGKDSTYNIAAAISGSNTIPTGDVASFYTPDGFYPAQEATLGASKTGNPQSLEQLKESINNNQEDIVSENNFSQKIEDFREGSTNVYSLNYSSNTVRRETRVNLGDQGKKKAEGFYTSYSNVDPDAIDTINQLDISDTRIDGTDAARDLAKFYFEVITPDGSKFLHFRAFIDNIDDSYNADWQGFNYVGRGEKFYTYGGFERDITVGFKIAAATRSELKPLYRKMVYLASVTAPTYGGQGFMRGTLARMTIGSYFSQIPGIITSVKYNLIDDMPWEIAMQNPEGGTDDDVQELPMGLQCSISFKAIHDFAPVTGLKHYFTNQNPTNGAQKFF